MSDLITALRARVSLTAHQQGLGAASFTRSAGRRHLALIVAAAAVPAMAQPMPHPAPWPVYRPGPVYWITVPVLNVQPRFERVRVVRVVCDGVEPRWPRHRPVDAGPMVEDEWDEAYRDDTASRGPIGARDGEHGPRQGRHSTGSNETSGAPAHGYGPGHARPRPQCRELVHWRWQPAGYLVTYAIGWQTRVIHMHHHPGAMLRLDLNRPPHGR